MNQDKLSLELQSLERRIHLLLKEHKSMKEENSFLKRENQEVKQILHEKEDQINSFQNQIKISKIVDSIAVENDQESTAELKLKINEYIKEIDRCIAHLSE
jgi:predicted RNase H-like nuclease (RuvC/YqgF family)